MASIGMSTGTSTSIPTPTSSTTITRTIHTVRIAGQGEFLAECGVRKTGSTIRPAVIYGYRVARRLARELAESNPRISTWAEPAPGATDGWRVGIGINERARENH